MSKILQTEEKNDGKVCELKNCIGTHCHWIIVRNDGKAIWRHPFSSKENAEQEMKFENLFNYGKIEHRFVK